MEQMGKRVQFVLQAVFFILCGAIIVIWESFGKVFQTVYEKGSEYSADLLRSSAPTAAPQNIKVRIFPIDHYSRLSIDEIISRLETLSSDELQAIKNFETGQQNRTVILEAIEKRRGEVR